MHDTAALSCGMYRVLGRIMGHAITHGATALPGVSSAAIAYLITGNVDDATEKLVFEDLCDPELRQTIVAVRADVSTS